MEYLLTGLACLAALIAAVGRTWDHSKGGRLRFTRLGYAAVVVAMLAFILSLIVISKNDREQRELDRNQKEQIEYQKSQLGVSQSIKESEKEQLDISKGLTEQQIELLKKSNVLTEKQVELLERSKVLTQSQRDQLLLSSKLAGSQEKQIRQLERLSLDRDLSGVEVSFKPSADHWARIAHACDTIKPLSPGFPYSASTVTAERIGGYWDIIFSEIRNPVKGTIRPPPVSTDLLENKPFEKVIDSAFVELLIRWSDDLNLESLISSSGFYPTSVTISKDKIAYIFRPPKFRLTLAYLHAKPTITFRGQQAPSLLPAPAYLRVRSLDYRVKFDQLLELDWKWKRGEPHSERWMPYISGPHSLKIDWGNVLPRRKG